MLKAIYVAFNANKMWITYMLFALHASINLVKCYSN